MFSVLKSYSAFPPVMVMVAVGGRTVKTAVALGRLPSEADIM